MLKLILISAMLRLLPSPPTEWGETESDYRARVDTIATAISATARDRREAFAVLTVFWWESRFRADVHSGQRLGDRGRAICLGQHHHNGRAEDEWRGLAGTDIESTTRCALATVTELRRARGYCARLGLNEPVHAFTLYGSGRRCRPSETQRPHDFARRAVTMRRLMEMPHR